MTPPDRMRDALIAFYADRADDAGDTQDLHQRIVARLQAATPRTPPAPRALPATRHWDALLARGALSPFPALNEALAALAPTLHWQQNPNYSDAVMGDGYMDNYGYAALAGGDGAFLDAEDIRIGLLLIGPHRHYPPHSHKAEEVYSVLASSATRWRRGEEDWRTYPLGAPIHHPPWMVHETQTGEEALLALYCWYGESANATLVGDTTTKP